MMTSDQSFGIQWIECVAGPADGELVAFAPEDVPTFPYITSDDSLYWYDLYQHSDEGCRFYYNLYKIPIGWHQVHNTGAG